MTEIDIIPGPIGVTFTILYFIYLNESPLTEIRNQIQVKCKKFGVCRTNSRISQIW